MNTKRAALYCRISETDEKVDKTANQEERLRALAEQAGYTVAEVFTDENISAYKGKLERPAFTRMLADTKAGKFDVLMATEPERFTRGSASQMEALQYICVEAGAVIHTASVGVQDPSTPMVRAFMQIMDTLGGLEVETKTLRQRERIKDDVRQGKPLWGKRPFGFTQDRLGVVPEEAEAIREAYRTMFDGGTLYGIAKAWNAAGFRTGHEGRERKSLAGGTTVASGKWNAANVKAVLTNPRVAGIQMHKGEEVGEHLPAIVSRAEWQELCALLADPSRKPKVGAKSAHLLSGIIRCSCGAYMTAGQSQSRGYSYTFYKCRQSNYEAGHQSIRREVADEAVTDAVVLAAAEGTLEGQGVDTEDLKDVQRRVTEALRQKDAAMDVLMDPDIRDKAPAKARVKVLESELDTLAADRARLVALKAGGSALDEFVAYMREGHEAGTWAHMAGLAMGWEAWQGLPLEKRRDIIRGSFSVTVAAGRGAERIQVERA